MINISYEENQLLRINNPQLLHQFHHTNFQQTPIVYYLMLFIILSFLLLFQIANILKNIHDSSSLLWMTLVGGIFVFISWITVSKLLLIKLYSSALSFSWTYTSTTTTTTTTSSSTTLNTDNYSTWIHYLRMIMIISIGLFQNLRYIELNIIGNCRENVTYTKIFCEEFDYNTASLIMILSPLFITTLCRNYHFHINIIYFLTSIITLMIGNVLHNHYPTLFIISFSGICGFFFMYDLQIQSVSMFLLNHKLQDTLDENEKNADRIHADEMRHMIANVAHDLKTPLTSFMTGMDLIAHLAIDCQQKMDYEHSSHSSLFDGLSGILQCLENVRNTNSFMLMTINRCIDYTKASKGMKLVPRYETFDLLDTLNLPLSCMKNIQHRIKINLNAISKDICSHIITDLQWLQENILCLLSNAVKYSTEGSVTITVSLIDVPAELLSNKVSEPKRSFLFSSSRFQKIAPADDILEKNEPESLEVIFSREPSKISIRLDGEDLGTITKHIRFEIEDTGIGMSDEAMASLFNPFKQTQRLAGGTGLGLYSLAKRVEALNGKYGVRRRRDGQKGSLFWFSFPYRPDETYRNSPKPTSESSAKELPISTKKNDAFLFSSTKSTIDFTDMMRRNSIDYISERSTITNKEPFSMAKVISPLAPIPPIAPTTSAPTSPTKSWHILLVDDSPTILKMTSMMLSKHGHFVYLADNGEEAVKHIQNRWEESQSGFDLVLMDLQMPVMDGLEATRRIRKFEQSLLASGITRSPQIVIGFSANSDNETTEEALKAGVNSFIPKPFKIETFYTIANGLIN